MLTSNLLKEDPKLIGLIDKFILRIPVLRDSINSAFNGEEFEEFSGLIHQVKGVGGAYGYPALTEICIKIEDGIRNDNLDKVKLLMNDFDKMIEEIILGSDENHRIVEQHK